MRLVLLFAAALSLRADILVTSAVTDSVLRYDSLTGAFIDTFITAGSGGLDDPRGIVVAPNGDVLVASFVTDQILRYSSTGAFLGVFADNASGLNGPFDIALGPGNILYAASAQANAIHQYDAVTGASLGTFVTDSVPTPLNTPRGLAIGNGRLYTSTEGDRIRAYDLVTALQVLSFLGDNPRGLAVGPDNNLYVASSTGALVSRFNGLTGAFIDEFVTNMSGGLGSPMGVRFLSDGNLYVASRTTDEILRYSGATGAFSDVFVAAGSGGLNDPHFITEFDAIPEPGTIGLVLAGLLAFVAVRLKPFRRPSSYRS